MKNESYLKGKRVGIKLLIFIVIFLMGFVVIRGGALNTREKQINPSPGKTLSFTSEISRSGSTIYARDNFVYLYDSVYGLEIYDVSTITKPVLYSSKSPLLYNPVNMIVQKNFIFLYNTNYRNSYVFLNSTDLSNITVIPQNIPDVNDEIKITIQGWNLFIINQTTVSSYDFTNFTSPALLNQYVNSSSHFLDIAIKGNFAYVLERNLGLTIFNITNPAEITKIKDFKVNGDKAFTDFYITEELIFLYEYRTGFHIINITNPIAPEKIAFYEQPKGYSAMAIRGDLAITLFDSSFQILNISTLSAIQLLGNYETEMSVSFKSLFLKDNYVFIRNEYYAELQEEKLLFIIDISDPSSPRHIFPKKPNVIKAFFEILFAFIIFLIQTLVTKLWKPIVITLGIILGAIILLLTIVGIVIYRKKKKRKKKEENSSSA
ncbi:MAG: hypothetical protein K9W42_06250 [Candidatus Heimdallarchaeota archaeon]|nr:hypothetical protein [Candidatus Heimdallarchaeota archaeon]